MSDKNPSNVLLVEGNSDQRVLPYLMEENGIPWPKGDEPVDIRPLGSVEELLKPDIIEAHLKQSGLNCLGMILDANASLSSRWASLGDRLKRIMTLPDKPHQEGIVRILDTGIRFGVWMMPDNRSSGMLETFLGTLVRDSHDPLWKHTEEAAVYAKTNFDAPFKDAHHDKARIHTFLAWSDPPGRQLHEAIMHKVLDPRSPRSKPFVEWFRKLYDL